MQTPLRPGPRTSGPTTPVTHVFPRAAFRISRTTGRDALISFPTLSRLFPGARYIICFAGRKYLRSLAISRFRHCFAHPFAYFFPSPNLTRIQITPPAPILDPGFRPQITPLIGLEPDTADFALKQPLIPILD